MRPSLAGVALAMLSVALTAYPVHAHGLPESPVPGTGLTDLLANPGQWASTMFNAALVGLGKQTTGEVAGFMGWLLGAGNVISQTPPGLSYSSDVVTRLSGVTRLIANGALAAVIVWGGVNAMVHHHIRAPYHGALELIPRCCSARS